MERAITAFARNAAGGLILTGSGLAVVRRDQIIKLAAEHRLPAVYYERHFVAAGGLISYGPDFVDQFRQAASYVDRILRARSRLICLFKPRASMNSRSILKPLKLSVSRCRPQCLRAPTKLSSKVPYWHIAICCLATEFRSLTAHSGRGDDCLRQPAWSN